MTNLIILFIFVPILAVILLALNVFLASHKPDEAKNSSYECGYDSIHGQTRTKFHIHFFVIALLFLLFDLEIVLLLPLATSLQYVGLYGFTIALIFFGILTIGFVFEIGTGAIKLSNLKSKSNPESKQINQSENKIFDNNQIIESINVNKTSTKNKYNYNNSLSNSIMFNKQNINYKSMYLQKSNFHSSALLLSENGNGNRKSF
jgi:NADH-ubiquinone oxidoreductase chain 3